MICISLTQCCIFSFVLTLIYCIVTVFLTISQEIGWERILEVTYLLSCGTLNLNSVIQYEMLLSDGQKQHNRYVTNLGESFTSVFKYT